jgi:site-specific recombinase XerD
MNDLILRSDFQVAFPGLAAGLREAQRIFETVKSFEDIERIFLKGAGLSANTYRCYLGSVRAFYEWSGGKHPLQITAADVEGFYDELLKRVDRATAYNRIQGLKRFFAGVQTVVPIFSSPFKTMTEKLLHKLNRCARKKRTKSALTKSEALALLAWLGADATAEGQEDHAIVMMLLTSGLRGSEFCQLSWDRVQFSEEDGWYFRFVAKGGDEQEQELYAPAVDLARKAFAARFGHEPKPTDVLFWTLPAYQGDRPRPLAYHALWTRVHRIGERARVAGILKRELQFSPHLFRRSFATLLARSGMDLKSVQVLTRHASIETLCKHYVDTSEKSTPAFARILAEVAA